MIIWPFFGENNNNNSNSNNSSNNNNKLYGCGSDDNNNDNGNGGSSDDNDNNINDSNNSKVYDDLSPSSSTTSTSTSTSSYQTTTKTKTPTPTKTNIEEHFSYPKKIEDSLPVRIVCNHFCIQNDNPFSKAFFVLFYFGMGLSIGLRYRSLYGSITEILYQLQSYGTLRVVLYCVRVVCS
jgi:hypothetical protein